jgi:hypothetical protein
MTGKTPNLRVRVRLDCFSHPGTPVPTTPTRCRRTVLVASLSQFDHAKNSSFSQTPSCGTTETGAKSLLIKRMFLSAENSATCRTIPKSLPPRPFVGRPALCRYAGARFQRGYSLSFCVCDGLVTLSVGLPFRDFSHNHRSGEMLGFLLWAIAINAPGVTIGEQTALLRGLRGIGAWVYGDHCGAGEAWCGDRAHPDGAEPI